MLQVVHQAGVKVPRPLWLCRDMRVHGRVFFLMEYVPGVAAGRLLSAGTGPQGRAQLAAQLGANLARLHQVRPPCAALDFLPMPTRSPALATIDAYRHYLDTLADAYPVLEWGLRWCELHAPRNSIRVCCTVTTAPATTWPANRDSKPYSTGSSPAGRPLRGPRLVHRPLLALHPPRPRGRRYRPTGGLPGWLPRGVSAAYRAQPTALLAGHGHPALGGDRPAARPAPPVRRRAVH